MTPLSVRRFDVRLRVCIHIGVGMCAYVCRCLHRCVSG